MRKYILTLLPSLLLSLAGFAQQSVCIGDSVKMRTQEHRGDRFWQSSVNGTDWTRMEGESAELLNLKPETSAYYRYEVFEGTCNPVYSDALQIIVHPLPVVSLQSIDSICQNAANFLLQTGLPAGGTYSGPGVTDGRFIPQMAGAGTHQYTYIFTSAETDCTNSQTATITVLPLPTPASAGADLTEIMQDSVQLNASDVTSGTGIWTITSGSGGHFSDPSKPDSWFYKGSDLNYTLKWTVSNSCATYSDEINLQYLPLSSNPCPGTPVVYDADGNMYPTVQIGNQCWMGKNLKVGVTVTSTVSSRAHSDAANNGIIERYVLNNDEANADIYGGYYDWDEMMGYTNTEGVQGICPDGWHIPTKAEWEEVNTYYKKTDTGDKLKEGNESGFEGQLAGDRHNQGSFVSFNSSGFFWTSSSYTYGGANEGWVREICACNSNLDEIHFSKKTGASVRCIKNQN